MEQLEEVKISELEKEITHERERLSSDRMDISFGELINLYKSKELIIRPEYQRLYRWNDKQKTALIESILLNIPIPPIFVAEDEDGIWELVDGLQRVTTFISFFGELSEDLTISYEENEDDNELDASSDLNEKYKKEDGLELLNKWTLEAGSLIKSLEGLNFDTLPKKYIINLKRAVCRVEILRGESNTAMKYELFKRLNSGGSKLTPQEIRNAIYRGINPVINELILDLSRNKTFVKLTTLSKQKKQELYDQELILRFVALLNNVDNVNNNLENYLDHFMETKVSSEDFNESFYKSLFNDVYELLEEVGDDKIFRNDGNLFVPALYEGITIGIAQNIEKYRSNPHLISSKIAELKLDEDFKRFSGSASNSRSRIKKRLQRANEIFAS
ncbi:MAG: DUF262 domain-containing protein [Cyclobacteriaceae bacterium]|nr:DUF262 domain-containing protein [Cyclobacteriaceae bacterium]MCH8514978.1 DUF262 domain-containing protein [Cyclobacteriaceae bacterium]